MDWFLHEFLFYCGLGIHYNHCKIKSMVWNRFLRGLVPPAYKGVRNKIYSTEYEKQDAENPGGRPWMCSLHTLLTG